MLTKMKIALALCASLAAGGVATADGIHGGAAHAEKKAEMLAKYDTNKDGKLDDSEKAAMRDARATEAFKKLDTNGDGQLSLAEFKAGRAKLGMHRHARGGFHRGMRGKAAAKP